MTTYRALEIAAQNFVDIAEKILAMEKRIAALEERGTPAEQPGNMPSEKI